MNNNIVVFPVMHFPSSWWSRWFRFDSVMQFAVSLSKNKHHRDILLEEEFQNLISRENATISKICFSYACSVAEYDDLRQDALINIWRGMQRFRSEASERTWVYRVTINSCISTIRKQIRHRHDSLDKLYSYMAENNEEREQLEAIHMIINQLGYQERAIIMMWLDDMSYDEIASTMGLNRNTVATRLRRIKDKIANQYKKEKTL